MKSLSVSIKTLIIIILFSTISLSQQKINYTDLNEYWQRIEKYEKERLPKSALVLLDTIYNEAVRLKDSQQLIKSLIYKYKFIKDFEPDAYNLIILQLQSEINKQPIPAKNILHSILAAVYDSYLTDNFYKLKSRTETIGYQTEDFSTWSVNNFSEKTNFHFEQSLTGKDALQKIPIEYYIEILIDTNETLRLRPTLFDLLSHRYLDFLQKDESFITKPAEEFQITTLDGFVTAEKFLSTEFYSPDSLSSKLRAINIYKDLISFHKQSRNVNALIDVDLWRLVFFYNYTVNKEKSNAFLDALNHLTEKYKNESRTAAVHLEKAAIYFINEKLSYPENFLSHKAMAKSICELIIKNYADTKFSEKAKVLLNQITEKSYSINFEKTTLPEKPFRGSISFQNIDKINFHIVRLPDNLLRFDSNKEIDYDSILTLNPSVKFLSPFTMLNSLEIGFIVIASNNSICALPEISSPVKL